MYRSLDRCTRNMSLLAEGDLGNAIATYEAHPRRPTDTRACSAVSTMVPQYQLRKAHSTTPGEDPPQVAPRSTPPPRTKKGNERSAKEVIVAIHARKGTDQNLSDQEKSITRQIQHARAYAAKKGWTVADEHVYSSSSARASSG